MNKYGYKVCYRKFGKHKIKIHLITNSYELALLEIQYYESHKQNSDRIWIIKPIKNYFEYKWLWRGCPF